MGFEDENHELKAELKQKYLANCEKFKELDEDYNHIKKIYKNFKENKIKCVKYNHSFLFEYQQRT